MKDDEKGISSIKPKIVVYFLWYFHYLVLSALSISHQFLLRLMYQKIFKNIKKGKKKRFSRKLHPSISTPQNIKKYKN